MSAATFRRTPYSTIWAVHGGSLRVIWRRLLVLLAVALGAAAQVTVTGKVTDENGVAVAGARLEIAPAAGGAVTTLISGQSGEFSTAFEAQGEYRIRAEKQGFFLLKQSAVTLRAGDNHLAVTLNHVEEMAESVSVVYSPPAIDMQEPNERKQLNSVEILSVPYPAPQDFRNALPLFQGVVQDTQGRLHFNGGSTGQTYFTLDGFNITDPVTGRLSTRLDIEAVRSLDLDTTRFSAEKGKGSAGSLDIQTKMGDDRWRFGGTNFIPSLSTDEGLHFNKWTPRLELSGPLKKGRAWFHNGFDLFYDVDTIHGLPSGQNRSRGITGSDLSRFQVNITPANILTGSFLMNYADRTRTGLSFLDPAETTTSQYGRFYMGSLKDQIYLPGGALLEVGMADSRGYTHQLPQGHALYEITPFGRRGNYFVDLDRHFYRQQWLANAFLPTFQAHGSHQLKMGIDLDTDSFHQKVMRHDYEVVRADLSVARYVTFTGNTFQGRKNLMISEYVQDRWTPREGILVEAGLRGDWDQLLRQPLWSPRISVAWAPSWLRETKFAAGVGIFHDAVPLSILTQHQDQVSLSTFYGLDGAVRFGPVATQFLTDEHALRAPQYRTESFSVERKLPFDLYGKASYTRKRGSRGFTFVNDGAVPPGSDVPVGLYELRNSRRDRYYGLEFSVRRTFGRFEWAAGYTRSAARSDAVVDYSLEDPIFGLQAPGPLAWDTPDRFLMWGWAPVPKRLLPHFLEFAARNTDAGYLVEYRTGFPFSVVSDEGYLAGPPNALRYPNYFNINLHFERRFRALHYMWAWRFGFNNLTNNGNPNTVNNNIDSPDYLTYGRGQLRAFSVRLRFLGKR